MKTAYFQQNNKKSIELTFADALKFVLLNFFHGTFYSLLILLEEFHWKRKVLSGKYCVISKNLWEICINLQEQIYDWIFIKTGNGPNGNMNTFIIEWFKKYVQNKINACRAGGHLNSSKTNNGRKQFKRDHAMKIYIWEDVKSD